MACGGFGFWQRTKLMTLVWFRPRHCLTWQLAWCKLLRLALMLAAARAAAPALADPHALTRQGKDAASPLAAVPLRTMKSNHLFSSYAIDASAVDPRWPLCEAAHTNASASNQAGTNKAVRSARTTLGRCTRCYNNEANKQLSKCKLEPNHCKTWTQR